MVCRFATLVVSPAKTAEPIEIPFGLRTRVGPENHVLDWGPDPPWQGVILRREGAAHCKEQGHSAVTYANTAEPIVMLFKLWAWTH